MMALLWHYCTDYYMRISLKFLLLLPVVFVISCSERSQIPNKGFEGKIVQKITLGGGLSALKDPPKTITAPPEPVPATGPSVSVTMYTKGDKVAYDIPIPIVGDLHFIVDRNSRTLTALVPNKVAYVSDLRTMDKTRATIDDSLAGHHAFIDSLQAHMPKPTGQKKTINGLAAEEYKTSISGTDITLWLTQDSRLKFYDVIRDAFLGKVQTGLGGLEEVFAIIGEVAGEGKVPVSMEVVSNGRVLVKSELSEMSEETVDDAVFEVPKDYTIQKTGLEGQKKGASEK
jgi:hypothetical protein